MINNNGPSIELVSVLWNELVCVTKEDPYQINWIYRLGLALIRFRETMVFFFILKNALVFLSFLKLFRYRDTWFQVFLIRLASLNLQII